MKKIWSLLHQTLRTRIKSAVIPVEKRWPTSTLKRVWVRSFPCCYQAEIFQAFKKTPQQLQDEKQITCLLADMRMLLHALYGSRLKGCSSSSARRTVLLWTRPRYMGNQWKAACQVWSDWHLMNSIFPCVLEKYWSWVCILSGLQGCFPLRCEPPDMWETSSASNSTFKNSGMNEKMWRTEFFCRDLRYNVTNSFLITSCDPLFIIWNYSQQLTERKLIKSKYFFTKKSFM